MLYMSPLRLVAQLTQLSEDQQHLVVSGGLRNFSSACFSSSSFSVSISTCFFSLHSLTYCSRSTEDFCCARSLLGMSWPGGREHKDSAHGAPAGYQIWAVASGRFLHHGLLQAHGMEKSSSTPARKRGFGGLQGQRRADNPTLKQGEQRGLGSPWVLPETGFYVTQRREHCTAALAFSIFSVTQASRSIWDLVASSLAPRVEGKQQRRVPAAAPVSHPPPHPARHSPSCCSCWCRLVKSMASSYLACCKDVHRHPSSR